MKADTMTRPEIVYLVRGVEVIAVPRGDIWGCGAIAGEPLNWSSRLPTTGTSMNITVAADNWSFDRKEAKRIAATRCDEVAAKMQKQIEDLYKLRDEYLEDAEYHLPIDRNVIHRK